jgi:hypothetical protein
MKLAFSIADAGDWPQRVESERFNAGASLILSDGPGF